MSTKHVRTGGDVLRFGSSVKVDCGHCGSSRTFAAMDWVMVAGGGSLEAARRRLKWGQCRRNASRVSAMTGQLVHCHRRTTFVIPSRRIALS
jgi:hypothetical protein